MLAVVAPGQGAQKSGFLAPWSASERAADRLAGYAGITGLDLTALGTTADDDTIRDTAIAQPLLVAAALLAATELFGEGRDVSTVGVLAGHSVGELATAAIAGVISDDDALALVTERGRAMAEAAAVRETSMTAVIGGDAEEVLAAIAAAGLTAANHNGSGQIVAAGTLDELAALQAAPPARARLIPLSVAGAFHTTHMQPAVERLRERAATVTTRVPGVRLLSNADGAVVDDGGLALDRIVAQVANPVRWDACLQTMAQLGVTGLLELPPAGTLTGIAKRNLRGADGKPIAVFALNTPDQLPEAAEFVAAHAGTTSDQGDR